MLFGEENEEPELLQETHEEMPSRLSEMRTWD